MDNMLATTTALALNFQDDSLPEWVQLTPPAPVLRGVDGRSWRMESPAAVVEAFHNGGTDLPIDIEHSTQLKGPKGEPAPAVGWIVDLDVREGALWGKVEWGDQGRQVILSRQYRFISPVISFARSTMDVVRLAGAGLTNKPNFQMTALNREGHDEENEQMDKAIAEALGLNADASAADAVSAINSLKTAEQTALNSAAQPDPERFVPMADHQLALNRIGAFEEEAAAKRKGDIEEVINSAIEDGKIAPASREYHLATCSASDDGFEKFKKFISCAPVIAPKIDAPKAQTEELALNSEEQAAAKALGMSTEDYIAAKNEDASK